MTRAGIAIEKWKLPIFERHLSSKGYAFTQSPGATPDTLLLSVVTENPVALAEVLRVACIEAAQESRTLERE